MENILLQDSENIKDLIRIIKNHGENVSRQLEITRVSKEKTHSNSYMECEYSSIPYTRPVYYHPTDPMILVKECGHAFRKEHFLQWIKKNDTCMECSALL